jgi:hypothetical protein
MSKSNYHELADIIESLPRISDVHGEQECFNRVNTFMNQLSDERKSFIPEDDKRERMRFREIIQPFLMKSAFCRYAIEKPRGYAGDFVTQEMIWRGRTIGNDHRYAGESELGRIINSLSLDMETCRANEERVNRLRSYIRSSGKRIASIGCGSCIELWNLPELQQGSWDIFLVDQDELALERAKIEIGELPESNVVFHLDNVIKFAFGGKSDTKQNRDLVYLFGLLDYFPFKHAIRIVHGVWDCVAPGGLLLVTNAAPGNPTKTWMEYGCDWYLDYKSEATMYELGASLAGVADMKVVIDSLGVYQFLEIRKAG